MVKVTGLAAAATLAGLAAVSARADDRALCQGLKAVWTAAKSDPASVRTVKLAGAKRCSFSDNDLRCFWVLGNPDAARRTYRAFATAMTACLAPLGLSPVHKVLDGVETTSLEPRDDREPNVDIFYPPGKTVVDISIVTAD